MSNLERVYIAEDGDGHYYIIPYELKDRFCKMLELSYYDNDTEASENFEKMFGRYLYGEDIFSTIPLYAEIK